MIPMDIKMGGGKFARIMPKKVLDNANKRIDGAVTMIMCYAC